MLTTISLALILPSTFNIVSADFVVPEPLPIHTVPLVFTTILVAPPFVHIAFVPLVPHVYACAVAVANTIASVAKI